MKRLARARGLTQIALAELIRVPPTTLNNWLFEGREPGQAFAIVRLASLLGTTAEDLVGELLYIDNLDDPEFMGRFLKENVSEAAFKKWKKARDKEIARARRNRGDE